MNLLVHIRAFLENNALTIFKAIGRLDIEAAVVKKVKTKSDFSCKKLLVCLAKQISYGGIVMMELFLDIRNFVFA